MLYFYFFTFDFYKFLQAGFYFDFFFKKFFETFLRNFIICTSHYFGEKYFIEVLTKKVIDNFIYNSNFFLGYTELSFIFYFLQIISTLFYMLSFINIFIIFF